jgi:hypothetical protein
MQRPMRSEKTFEVGADMRSSVRINWTNPEIVCRAPGSSVAGIIVPEFTRRAGHSSMLISTAALRISRVFLRPKVSSEGHKLVTGCWLVG